MSKLEDTNFVERSDRQAQPFAQLLHAMDDYAGVLLSLTKFGSQSSNKSDPDFLDFDSPFAAAQKPGNKSNLKNKMDTELRQEGGTAGPSQSVQCDESLAEADKNQPVEDRLFLFGRGIEKVVRKHGKDLSPQEQAQLAAALDLCARGEFNDLAGKHNRIGRDARSWIYEGNVGDTFKKSLEDLGFDVSPDGGLFRQSLIIVPKGSDNGVRVSCKNEQSLTLPPDYSVESVRVIRDERGEISVIGKPSDKYTDVKKPAEAIVDLLRQELRKRAEFHIEEFDTELKDRKSPKFQNRNLNDHRTPLSESEILRLREEAETASWREFSGPGKQQHLLRSLAYREYLHQRAPELEAPLNEWGRNELESVRRRRARD